MPLTINNPHGRPTTGYNTLSALTALINALGTVHGEGQQRQFQALRFLGQQPNLQLEPATPEEVQGRAVLDRLLGAPTRSRSGAPLYDIGGGQVFKVSQVPTFTADDFPGYRDAAPVARPAPALPQYPGLQSAPIQVGPGTVTAVPPESDVSQPSPSPSMGSGLGPDYSRYPVETRRKVLQMSRMYLAGKIPDDALESSLATLLQPEEATQHAAQLRASGPSRPASSPLPPTAPGAGVDVPAGGVPTAIEPTRTAQALARQPQSALVEVPGYGTFQRRDVERIDRLLAQNLIGSPKTKETRLKKAALERQLYQDAKQDQAELLKMKREVLKENPELRDAVKGATSFADLEEIAFQGETPQAKALAAHAAILSAAQAVRNPDGTYDDEDIAHIYDTAGRFFANGVKMESLELSLKAANVPMAQKILEMRREKAAALQAKREEATDPTIRQGTVETERAKAAARLGTKAIEDLDVHSRTRAYEIVKKEGTPPAEITADQIHRAVALGQQDREKEDQARREAQRTADAQAPIGRGLLGKYVHLGTGRQLDNPSLTPQQATAQGFVYADKPQQDTLRNGRGSLRFMDRARTLLFGGTDTDGSFTGTPGSAFAGLYPALETEQNLAQRAGRTLDIRTARIQGKTIGEWAAIYDNLINGSLGHIARDLGGERGHFTDKDAERAQGLFPKVGLRGRQLAVGKTEAMRLLSQVEGIINDRIASSLGVDPDGPKPWRERSGTIAPSTPQPGAPGATTAPPPSEIDAYKEQIRKLTGAGGTP